MRVSLSRGRRADAAASFLCAASRRCLPFITAPWDSCLSALPTCGLSLPAETLPSANPGALLRLSVLACCRRSTADPRELLARLAAEGATQELAVNDLEQPAFDRWAHDRCGVLCAFSVGAVGTCQLPCCTAAAIRDWQRFCWACQGLVQRRLG